MFFINLAQLIVLRTFTCVPSLHFWPPLDQQTRQLTLLPTIGFSFLYFRYGVRFVELVFLPLSAVVFFLAMSKQIMR
jgi:hypothetical protein